MSRSAAREEGYIWAFVIMPPNGTFIKGTDALALLGYGETSHEADEFVAGCEEAVNKMKRRLL